jgi:FG-GAP repeat
MAAARPRAPLGSRTAVLGILALTSALLVGVDGQLPASAASPKVKVDFNGDGYDDLAIGVPGEAQASGLKGGAVEVMYGSATGLTTAGSQLWSQDSPGISGSSEASDQFGEEVAAGDFNADGYTDLAIGAPNEDFAAGFVDDGVVHVLFGSAAGITSAGNQLFGLSTAGVPGDPQDSGNFGSVLAAGNLGRGSSDDLAIGYSHAVGDSGSVIVLYGGRGGITTSGAQRWTQASPGIAENPGESEQFGIALAIGNFGGNANSDLAIGVREDTSGFSKSGAVHVLYSGADGLTATGSQLWSQAVVGIAENPEVLDVFGDALAAGDLDLSGFDELIIGAPGESLPRAGGTDVSDAGVVHILFGAASGLSTNGVRYLSLDNPGAPGINSYARFGASFAVANFGGSVYPELAIGAPDAEVSGIPLAGQVHVLSGTASGPTWAGNQVWDQNTPGIPDAADPNDGQDADYFGLGLGAGRFGNAVQSDLVVGVSNESFTPVSVHDYHGAVQVIRGWPSGLLANNNQFWSQQLTGIAGEPERLDRFGAALS